MFLMAVSFLAAGVLFVSDVLLGCSGVPMARLAHVLCFATAWAPRYGSPSSAALCPINCLIRVRFQSLSNLSCTL
ncbi:hypothetical protein GUJ93_ZPchr0014g47629 [Zizania palustris]|uniref:Secreted protein n=1 Tax=Zizania palustris TaxID=103762 RepID=A0A8J5VRM6_ZIZPA|nr:hypothetical protein GUJ93_ZPchr0014g47629 [Zizania palustris]